MGLFSFLFSSDNSRHLKKLNKILATVLEKEQTYTAMSNDELKNTTIVLKERFNNGETLNQLLPDAFALVREAAWRVLKMKHFPVQILGGIALHQGRIAEMRTGEGKTLVSTLPAFLNALTGKGVHIVTVNEYLATRDAEWMGKVHRFLGLSVGVVVSGMSEEEKKASYNCDITYCTNNELGFDYLRDNMAVSKQQRMQRGYFFTIVDEVDSILIDEARTPLIISGKGMQSGEMYTKVDSFVKHLKKDEDYEIEIKRKTIHLTEKGIEKAERHFVVENLSDVTNIELNHHINNALRANFTMFDNENYIVKDDEILIVDEFTGRVMQGRRYSDGLHQAIEAKEKVKIKDENKTMASITFQNYFRMYKKLSGMTGTAKTEESEFNNIYGLDVVTIPTNLPPQRVDEQDIIYTTIPAKTRAIVEEIKRLHATGRPVLVGTITIEKSEELANELKMAKVKHFVLNAKNHEQESSIIAQAGRKNSVTIATNMAGRGTDILLGGNPEFMAKQKLKEEGFNDAQISLATSFEKNLSDEILGIKARYDSLYSEFKAVTDVEREEVENLGGLHIIGTERHESRRIDNQLRGRAGRQGDRGSSVFYISLEDDLAKRFGGEKMQAIAKAFRVDEDTPFQLKMLSKQIEQAQKRIEAQNYAMRKHVIDFDNVMNKQRELIYNERNKVIDGVDIHEEIKAIFPDMVKEVCNKFIDEDKPSFEWDLKPLNDELEQRLFPRGTTFVTSDMVEDCLKEEVQEKIELNVLGRFEQINQKSVDLGFDFSQFERFVLLKIVDAQWMEHIDQMSILKNEIGLRGYGQHDPVTAYKQEGFELFDAMIKRIREDAATILLNVNIEAPPEQKRTILKENKIITVSNKPESEASTPVEKTQAKSSKAVSRNDSCPCGSGKKYKNCCGSNL